MSEPLMNAARAGDLATIKRYYAELIDVTERGRLGCAAIMHAAAHDQVKTAKFLQAAGASIIEKNSTVYPHFCLRLCMEDYRCCNSFSKKVE